MLGRNIIREPKRPADLALHSRPASRPLRPAAQRRRVRRENTSTCSWSESCCTPLLMSVHAGAPFVTQSVE
jgi:hypothetical protein